MNLLNYHSLIILNLKGVLNRMTKIFLKKLLIAVYYGLLELDIKLVFKILFSNGKYLPKVPNQILKLMFGHGVEVGALSRPAILPYSKSIKFADIEDPINSKLNLESLGYFGYHGDKFVKIDYHILKDNFPFYKLLEDSKLDFVFSSHSLEHAPNPIASLLDYLRVVKPGGVIHTVIPNKSKTYDMNRKTTESALLIRKFKEGNFTFEKSEIIDAISSSQNAVYSGWSVDRISREHIINSGLHHVYIYDIQNIIEIINFVISISPTQLVYFDSNDSINLTFTLKKV